MGSSWLKFQRRLVTTPDYNYWKRPDSKTGVDSKALR